ncbi:MAG TPA: hypothetical protein VF989_12945 [Polyangiaceae bacterium]
MSSETSSAPELAGVGLCAECRHARKVTSVKRSTFWMCRRSAADARYRKYPPLPVIACDGFEAPSTAGDGTT